MRRLVIATAVLVLGSAGACDGSPSVAGMPRELAPVPNPFGPDDPLWAPQPHRDRPSAVVASSDGERLYVALQGTQSEPGREVAVVEASSLETLARIEVGPGPCALALHPDGRYLAVANRFARYVSIIDTTAARVTGEVPAPYYTEHIAFSPEGDRAWLANRWKNAVLRWEVSVEDGFRARVRDPLPAPDAPVGLPVPANPRRIVPVDAGRVLVTSETEMALTLLDVETGEWLAQHRPNGPVTDAAVIEGHVYVLHTGSGSAHPPDEGFDGDGDGAPGDGTANVGFQDLQNEIDVLRLPDLHRVHRYTSDTICCRDYRDVDPDRPDAGAGLAPRDAWPADRVAFLPPKDTWIVAGAMPERAVPFRRSGGARALAVVFGGSSEVQTFDVDTATGALAPRETATTGLFATGFGATDAVVPAGARLVVVDRLGETLTALDLEASPGATPRRVAVGDVSDGAFPATDVELGEAFNTVTAPFTVDGDQTCVHCHRDGTPPAKPVSMPLLDSPEWGVRLVMSYRQAYDSRPWFVEAAMDEGNFFPVINELARKENFCCEQRDPRVWSSYPSVEACQADGTLEGCGHVLDCRSDPPPECLDDPRDLALTRDAHFRAAAREVLGREESFGDSLFVERVGVDGEVEKQPVPLAFDGITRALGLFLLARPRALPNPNAAAPTVQARTGERLFRSSATGCASCHPLGVTATARPTVTTEAPGPITFPYLVTPMRHPDTGADVDRTSPAFLGTFPRARQTEGGLRIGVTQLRGAWNRARFLHHGRARSLREVLAPPGHPALRPGERGLNERDGQPNTHGSTSHLTADELEALVAFVETL